MNVLDRFRLDGKRLFITGGSRGLGREMSLACAEAGADVILVGRDSESLEATAEDIRERGQQAITINSDIGQLDQCEAACQSALQEHGPIDILQVEPVRQAAPVADVEILQAVALDIQELARPGPAPEEGPGTQADVLEAAIAEISEK